MRRRFLSAAIVMLLSCATAFAQQTTGNVTGRVLDPQGAAIPGATVTAKSTATGFTRTETSDAEGVYRLASLPVGDYDVTAELQGFTTVANKAIVVQSANWKVIGTMTEQETTDVSQLTISAGPGVSFMISSPKSGTVSYALDRKDAGRFDKAVLQVRDYLAK